MSYCPDLPDELQISTVRVYVDRAAVGEWAKDVVSAMIEVGNNVVYFANKRN